MKKGFSLVEIIISVGLIAIVMLFLFQILSDLQYEETTSNFASGNQMNRANVIKKVEDDFNLRFVKRIKLSKNEDNTVVTFSFQEGNSSTLTVTPKTISYKNGNLEEGKNVFTYKINDNNYEYDGNVKMTTDLATGEVESVNLFCEEEDSNCGTSQFHYVKIRIPVKNIKDSENNVQDDIELFYVGPFVEYANKYKRFTLESNGVNTSLKVERISSKREEVDLGELRNGDYVYEQDELKVSAEANTGYTNVVVKVNDNVVTNGSVYKVKDNETLGVVSVTSNASLQEFGITLSGESELPITLERTYTNKEGASLGVITNTTKLYYGDKIKVSLVNPNTAKFENLVLKVNGANFTSGQEIVITSNLLVNRTATIRSYVQTIQTRFQNADGTWGGYSTVSTPTKKYGETVTYSVAANNTYAAASIPSYQVTGTKTVQLDIPRRTSTNIIQVRYQNADGTYGAYSNAKNETLRVGQTVSWSRAQDATYVAASSSITATASNQTKQVSVARRTSTNVIQVRYQNADGSYGGYSNVVNTTHRVGQTVSWSRAQDGTYKAASISFAATASNQTKQVSVNRRTSTNIIQVRYQNADGSYGGYSNVVNTTHRVGQTVSWSRGQDGTYSAGSMSFTATASNQTKQLSITRRTYALTVNRGTGVASVSGGGTYRAGQTVNISASMTAGYRFTNWTKNAGTLTNANASSTSFVMPTSAATVTANGTLDRLYIYNEGSYPLKDTLGISVQMYEHDYDNDTTKVEYPTYLSIIHKNTDWAARGCYRIDFNNTNWYNEYSEVHCIISAHRANGTNYDSSHTWYVSVPYRQDKTDTASPAIPLNPSGGFEIRSSAGNVEVVGYIAANRDKIAKKKYPVSHINIITSNAASKPSKYYETRLHSCWLVK